ncbi:MAG: hypothetical protein OXI63_19350 [Candidatus Poribacteria bacterium]|nr:hypothetical protein [Candidatus Poribacteria bacterium]
MEIDYNTVISTIVGALAGGLVTIAVTIAVEMLRRPVLKLEIRQPIDKSFLDEWPAQRARFLHLYVRNIPLPGLLSWMSRNEATDSWGVMSFHHLNDGQNIFGHDMPVRWTESTEPHNAVQQYGYLDTDLMRVNSRRDIQPGETELMDVIARFDDESSCYGWNNESYYCSPLWRNPRWEIKPGRYISRVEIRTSGRKFVQYFRLCNEGAINSFRIESPQDEDGREIQSVTI